MKFILVVNSIIAILSSTPSQATSILTMHKPRKYLENWSSHAMIWNPRTTREESKQGMHRSVLPRHPEDGR